MCSTETAVNNLLVKLIEADRHNLGDDSKIITLILLLILHIILKTLDCCLILFAAMMIIYSLAQVLSIQSGKQPFTEDSQLGVNKY